MENILQHFENALSASPVLALLFAYLGGVLASLTPCVYPMLPITAGIIGHASVGGTRKRALGLSVLYVLGMALAYAALGFFAAATGRLFGALATSPLTLFILGGIFLFLGFWMLDLFHLPGLCGPEFTSLVQKGGALGIFLAGVSAAFVAGPCTTPVLAALLTYVTAKGNMLFGVLLFFVFSLGLGTLLLAVGAFSGCLAALPRSGRWMLRVKKALALLILAVSAYCLYKGISLVL